MVETEATAIRPPKSTEKTTNSDLFSDDPTLGKRLFTIEETAKILNLSERIVKSLIKEGKLAVVRINARVIRVSNDAITAFIKTHEIIQVATTCNNLPPAPPPPSPPVSPSSSPTPPITPPLSPSSSTTSPPICGPKPAKSYVFRGKVISLNEADFEMWRKSYRNIPNLAAELLKRDAWLSDQPEAARKKWFQSTAAWLARVDREINPTASAIDDLSQTLQERLKIDPEATLTEFLLPIWKRSEKHPTPEATMKFFRSMVDDATLLTYLKISKKNTPAGMPQIKYVHLMVIQGTDPRDLRPWRNGFPPPAKPKPGETEAQVNNRQRAENRYEGLNV